MRALAVIAVAGCATSTDLGVIQRNFGHDLGGSVDGHMGIGAIVRDVVVVDVSLRGDIADANSRFAYGAGVLGGLPIGAKFRALARIGVWNAPFSSAPERTLTPTFEVMGYIPMETAPRDPGSKYGWSESGVIFGVREDLDVSAYTTVFVGLQLFLIPGY